MIPECDKKTQDDDTPPHRHSSSTNTKENTVTQLPLSASSSIPVDPSMLNQGSSKTCMPLQRPINKFTRQIPEIDVCEEIYFDYIVYLLEKREYHLPLHILSDENKCKKKKHHYKISRSKIRAFAESKKEIYSISEEEIAKVPSVYIDEDTICKIIDNYPQKYSDLEYGIGFFINRDIDCSLRDGYDNKDYDEDVIILPVKKGTYFYFHDLSFERENKLRRYIEQYGDNNLTFDLETSLPSSLIGYENEIFTPILSVFKYKKQKWMQNRL